MADDNFWGPGGLQGALQRRADHLGTDIAGLPAKERELLRKSSYPGPDCLWPHEWEMGRADLSADRLAHADICPMCEAMLEVCGGRATEPPE